MRLRILWAVTGCVVAGSCVLMSGCGGGGGEFDVVPITGKLTCNGEPVGPGVVVQFLPSPADAAGDTAVVGKSATGVVGEDGTTFTLSTYSEGDGAVVGRHKIIIMAASASAGQEEEEGVVEESEPEDEGEGDDDMIPLPCQAPADLFVEVTGDISVVTIEMAEDGTITTE